MRSMLNILIVFMVTTCFALVCSAAERSNPSDPNRYLNAVRTFADNVLKYGKDTYGPKHTPLFVDGLNIHTHEPVKWIAPNGERWILSNLASQQNLFRTLDGLTRITGNPKYKQAAMDAIEYAFENLRSSNGLFYWGGHAAYDAGADNPCGSSVHENKNFYPHYELMWEVNPTATRKFIESFWSGHILDWSNLDMDRHCYQMNQTLEEAWKHEYKGVPVFFESKHGIAASFITTAGGLIHGAATLTKLSGDGEPLVWAKRLAHRYVETRDSKTGIGAGIYTGKQTRIPILREIKNLDLNELGIDCSFPSLPTYGNSDMRQRISGYFEVSPGIPFNGLMAPWICTLLAGEMMGSNGRDFILWSVEELTAWGKVAYRKSENSWIPMLRNGTSLEGLVVKKDGPLGPKGTIVMPKSVISMDFWAYALAYRLTENNFMWQMVRNIALGHGFGDIGVSSVGLTKLEHGINCADPYALMGFLELYRKTQSKPFLVCAKQIGDNILASRFHKGFFAPTNKHFYARFDSPESLALLYLHASSMSSHFELPTAWPSKPLFEHAYRDKDRRDDNSLVYSLTESPEPPISLQEAAARGNLDLIKSLIEDGINVDSREDGFFKTALHRSAMSGHRDVVEYLLAKGAQVDAWNGFPGGTPLDYAAENGHKEIVELLLDKGANTNAKRGYPAGDTPLHSAVRAGHKDVIELLIAKKADVNARNKTGQTPVDVAMRQKNTKIVELLVEKGDFPLHLAAQYGLLEKLKELIEKGADINAKDTSGRTALHYAAEKGLKDLVELLIANGADVNVKDKDGNTPGHVALDEYNRSILKLLIAKGANFTSIHLSAYQGDLDEVRSFIDKGVDVNVKDKYGETPLHKAAIRGHKDVVEFLIDNAANVNATDQVNYTPLYCAVWSWDTETAELLIERGADMDAKDKWGWTPLHYAANRDNRGMAHLLITKGADVNAKDNSGETALSVAKGKGHNEMVELLRKHGAKEDKASQKSPK